MTIAATDNINHLILVGNASDFDFLLGEETKFVERVDAEGHACIVDYMIDPSELRKPEVRTLQPDLTM